MFRSPSRRGCLAIVALLGLSGIAAGTRAAGWVVDVDAGLTYDDNVGRAQRGGDRFGDERAHLGATLRRSLVLGESLGLGVNAAVVGTKWESFDDFDSIEAAGALRGRFQPVRRFGAPWFEFDLEAAYWRHQSSAIRDGPRGTALAAVAFRPSDVLLVRAGYGFDIRRGRDSAVFDTESHRLFAHFDYRLNGRITLYATGGWRDAEVVSTSTPNQAIVQVANAITTDRAMGTTVALEVPGHTSLPPGQVRIVQRVAYQIDASIYDAGGGVNWGIGNSASIDARAGYFESRGRGGNDYNGFQIGLNFVYRYH